MVASQAWTLTAGWNWQEVRSRRSRRKKSRDEEEEEESESEDEDGTDEVGKEKKQEEIDRDAMEAKIWEILDIAKLMQQQMSIWKEQLK
mmetsp:Transcript_140421/g.269299  ORF Transcript_140421/g.269299 Transcript_140421/m.269299 type:complete len:89 (+) Transcript_140421:193-459(+)